MARPGSQMDKKLLSAGLTLIAQNGTKALTIRRICRQAGANLGMFTYFFKNKETFLKAIFETIYADLERFLDMNRTKELNELQRLRHFSERFTVFAFQNKNLLRAVFVECSLDKDIYETYIRKGVLKPFDLPFRLVREAQQAGFVRTDLSEVEIHRILFFGIVMPILFSECSALLQFGGKVPVYGMAESRKRINELFDEVEIKK